VRALAVLTAALALVATASATSAARRPAPQLAGVTLAGKQLSLAKLRGKPVFINVWSSW
jgi:phosphate-selective porin